MERPETIEDWYWNLEAGTPSPNASERDLAMRDLMFLFNTKPKIEKDIHRLKSSLNRPRDIMYNVMHERWKKVLKRRQKSLIWIRNKIKTLAYQIATTS